MAASVCKVGTLLTASRTVRLPLVACVRYKKYEPKNEKDNLSWALPLVEQHLREKAEGPPAEKEPSKLLMVWRTNKLFGRPYWEKKTMKDLSLDGKRNKFVVHKNIPSVTKKLKSVLHLIEVIPVTFPHGLPQTEEEMAHCLLQDNGHFVVQKTLRPLSEVPTTDETDPQKTVWKLNPEIIQKHLRRKLDTYQFHTEYFKPNYRYKYNQDGKEHRYFGDTNVGAGKEWF